MGFLLDNILQQAEVVRQTGKKPERLICDADSWDALVNEFVPSLPMYPMEFGKLKIYGLEIEFCPEPNFEVR